MAAYIHANVEVTDPAVFKEYQDRVPAVIAAHGGRYLVRGGAAQVLEGDTALARQVIVEFPDMAKGRDSGGSCQASAAPATKGISPA